MDMDKQVQNAIEIAWNPSSDQDLKLRAIGFLEQLRSQATAWRVCLSLFTRSPKPPEVVRHFALEIINAAIQTQRLEVGDLKDLKDNLLGYIQLVYGGSDSTELEVDSASIQNKITQTVTFLFVALYADHWQNFFDFFLALALQKTADGRVNTAGMFLYLRVASSVHEEIADVLVIRTTLEQQRNNMLKDLIRQRDVQKIALSWQEILSQRQEERMYPVMEMCLKVIGRWVSWIEISFVINENLMNMIFDLIAQSGAGTGHDEIFSFRNAAVETLSEIVNKKMKPAAKLELISILKLETIIEHLFASPELHALRSGPYYDIDLAEAVAKLVNNATTEIIRALESDAIELKTKEQAQRMIQVFLGFALRLFSDEYDEICSSVIPCLTDLLTYLRKEKLKGTLPTDSTAVLAPILKAIVLKMKYDETSSWGQEDAQTDEAEFQELRRRLHVLQQAVAAVDENLYTQEISQLALVTFDALKGGSGQINWRDLDLVLHEMFLFGDLAVKQGGLYLRNQPTARAAETLIHMMTKMIESGIASNPHPAVQIQYMEICVRYGSFFEMNPQYIPRVLEDFVGYLHHEHLRVRTRSWYLFLRFVKHLRKQLGDVARTVVGAIGDLLVIHAVVPRVSSPDHEDGITSDEDEHSPDRIFTSQLSLFEAVGCITSIPSIPITDQVSYAQAVCEPILADVHKHLPAAKAGEAASILQINHDILALGTIAHGFSNWAMGSTTSNSILPPPAQEVSTAFGQGAEVVLLALESLNSSVEIRTACRSAFSRLVGVLGSQVLPQLPRWIDGILSRTSSREEMSMFLRLLEQVIFSFRTEIFPILDSLMSPLLQRIFASLDKPTTGTDDEIHLMELRREYLSLLLIILHNELGAVLVSSANASSFNPLMTTLSSFALSPDDLSTARLTFTLLTRMCSGWGGPDVVNADAPSKPLPTPAPNTTPKEALDGFPEFMLSTIMPLCFGLPLNDSFEARDAHGRSVLGEIAGLQKVIYGKLGERSLTWLRQDRGLGEDYIEKLRTGTGKEWRDWFVKFVSRKGS